MSVGLPLLWGTIVAFVLAAVGVFFAPGPDKSLNRLLVGTSFFCCWLMWLIVYMAQMNPLVNPDRTGE